ncbi:MAG: ABC transporter permease [Chloroflexi bacterium]|nr:ABC transporter permease [Chloroflexota bacterium]
MKQHSVQVFLYELRRNLRRKGFLFTTFGIPLLAYVLFFGYQIITNLTAGNEQAPDPAQEILGSDQFATLQKAGYVDLSGLFPSPDEQLGEILAVYPDEAAAAAAMNAGEIDAYYIIPANYLETGDVTLVMPRFSLGQTTDAPVRRLVLSHLARDVDQDLFNRLVNPANIQEINLQRDASGETTSNFDTDFVVVYVFAVALMLSVFTTNGYLMQTIIEEKETRLIEILISGMRPTRLLAGKILALGLLGLLQIVVWVVALLLLANIATGNVIPALAAIANISLPPDKVLILLVYFIFGYLFFAGAYGMVSAISTSMQEGPQYAVIFTLPAVIPLYFVALFIASPDATLPVILSLFPVTSPLAMVMRISITTVPIWQILLSLALLVILDAGMIWMAGRMFRVNTLLAGQTPKLKDIPRLLRG